MLSTIAISLFWFLPGTNQVIFCGLTNASTQLWSGLCLGFGLLHLIPVIRKWKKIPNEAQPRDLLLFKLSRKNHIEYSGL